TPEELEDVSDFEDDHDVRSHTSNQTEGKTDRKQSDIQVHKAEFTVNPDHCPRCSDQWSMDWHRSMGDSLLVPGDAASHFCGLAKMTQLPEAEKEKIAEQVADFKKVKSKLDEEIEIWDDTSNDIIVLAKQMCVIMMEMTDFT
ncbi:Catenin alpha-3, partial [Varanus komodoensis]